MTAEKVNFITSNVSRQVYNYFTDKNQQSFLFSSIFANYGLEVQLKDMSPRFNPLNQKEMQTGQTVVVQAFNPNTSEVEVGGYLRV